MSSLIPDTDAARTVAVFVVGAGPAGLSLATQLRRRGIDHVVADRHGIGGSWARMPEDLHLVSPWWTNALAWRDIFHFSPFSCVSATRYAAYLQRYAQARQLKVPERVAVEAVRRETGSAAFRVDTSAGTWLAETVVVASGYFQSPRPPQPAYADDGSVPTWHAAAIPSARELAELSRARSAPVVVVGKRISAGQIALALHDAGCRVRLCSRQPLEFRLDGLRGAAKDFIYYFYEELRMRLQPRITAASFPAMDGGRVRTLVEAGTIATDGPIESVADGAVVTAAGRTPAAAIIQATGYAPTLEYLAPLFGAAPELPPLCTDWQVDGQPGLFLLGMDNCMNYRSRTLRGIRSDAVHVAAHLARFLSRR